MRFLFVILFSCLNLIQYSLNANMCTLDDVHALILARGGSKGIKLKNLTKIDHLTMLARALITIQESGLFKYIWVSTDNQKIADEAIKYNALVHKREPFYAQDETSSLASVREFLDHHYGINRFVLFQCTSIFLRKKYIEEGFEVFQSKDCVFTVTRQHKLRWTKMNEQLLALNFNPKSRPRRQDWDGELVENGMFYFSTRKLVEEGRFQNENCTVIEINNCDSLEIDTLDDVSLAQCLLSL